MIISSAEEMVSLAPNLIGFTPEESLVLVATDINNNVVVSVRMDLDSVLDLGPHALATYVKEHLPTTVTHLSPAVYTSMSKAYFQHTVKNLTEYQNALQEFFTTNNPLLIHRSSWTFLECDEECCGLFPIVPLDSVDAEFIGLGHVTLSTREDINKEFETRPYDLDTFPLDKLDYELTDKSTDAQIFFADRAARVIKGQDSPTSKALVELSYAVRNIRTRDLVIRAMAEVPIASGWFVYDIVVNAYRLAPHQAIATLAACAAYLNGDGARANIACGIAQEIDPDYSLNNMLSLALQAGMPPNAWREMVLGISQDEMVGIS